MGRQQIAQSALRLLNVDPTASMAQIAASAGVSRATLHRNFASREELLGHLGKLSLDSWRDALDSADIDAAAASGDATRIRTALETLCGHLIRDAEEYGFTWTEHSLQSDDEIVARSEVLKAREHTFYTAAQEAGVLRADVPVAWIGHTFFGLLIGLRAGLRYGDIAVRDTDRLLRETILHGLGAT